MAGPAQLTRGVSQLFLLLTQVSGCRDQQLRRVVTFLCRLKRLSFSLTKIKFRPHFSLSFTKKKSLEKKKHTRLLSRNRCFWRRTINVLISPYGQSWYQRVAKLLDFRCVKYKIFNSTGKRKTSGKTVIFAGPLVLNDGWQNEWQKWRCKKVGDFAEFDRNRDGREVGCRDYSGKAGERCDRQTNIR